MSDPSLAPVAQPVEPTFELALRRVRGLVNFRAVCGPVYETARPEPERPLPRKRGRTRGQKEQPVRKATGDYWWKLWEGGCVPFESAEQASAFADSVQELFDAVTKDTRERLSSDMRELLSASPVTNAGIDMVFQRHGQMQQLCWPWVRVVREGASSHLVLPTMESSSGMRIVGDDAATNAHAITSAINQSLDATLAPLLQHWQEIATKLVPGV